MNLTTWQFLMSEFEGGPGRIVVVCNHSDKRYVSEMVLHMAKPGLRVWAASIGDRPPAGQFYDRVITLNSGLVGYVHLGYLADWLGDHVWPRFPGPQKNMREPK